LRIVETIRARPGSAESASYIGFVLVLHLATVNRLSRFDLRFSISPWRSVRLLAPLGDEKAV
jgi:hypothetical protein